MPQIDVNGTVFEIVDVAQYLCVDCGGPCYGGRQLMVNYWPYFEQYRDQVNTCLNAIATAPESYGPVQRIQDLGQISQYHVSIIQRWSQWVPGASIPPLGLCGTNTAFISAIANLFQVLANGIEMLNQQIQSQTNQQTELARDIAEANNAIAESNKAAAEAAELAEKARLSEVTRKVLVFGAVALAVVAVILLFRRKR